MSKSARNEHKWSFDGTMKLPRKQPPPYAELTPPHWRKVRIDSCGKLFHLSFAGSRMLVMPRELRFYGVEEQPCCNLTIEQARRLGNLIEGKNKAGR